MMNQQQQSTSRSGSVKRARERVEARLQALESSPARQPRPYEQPRPAPSQPVNRARPQMPQALAGSRNGPGQIGVAISRPTPVPQWPLAGSGADSPNNQYQPPAGRGSPPRRPPRPSVVPSILDASRIQEHTPAFQYTPSQNLHRQQETNGRYQEDENTSPGLLSPMSMSSRPSTLSSVGSIPDFPIPIAPPPSLPGPPRRSANLGPPPSSRRGVSSYYSQATFVSPIPEESPRTAPSHQSYASSAAIPPSWGTDSPGYRYDDDDDDYERERSFDNDRIEDGRQSRESNGDDSDDRGLIRSASLGKRAKPSMITTRSSERFEPSRPGPVPQQGLSTKSKQDRMGFVDGAAPGALAGQRQTAWPTIGNPDSPLATGTGYISSSEESVPTVKGVRAIEASSGYTATADSHANPILGAYNAASSLSPSAITPARTPSPGAFSQLSAVRRPPRLNIDAVRDAESRGSLTSLPELIRRATRLAAMMDRGKRPGSRMNNLNDFPSDIDLSSREKDYYLHPDEKRQSTLSGMLAAFPPPGRETPQDGGARSSPFGRSGNVDPNAATSTKPLRRPCGLPCWGFLLLLSAILLTVAAAIVVPLQFLVLNKTDETPAPSALEQCQRNADTACRNGGASSIATGSCSCICINGFSGSTCTVASAGACTTTNFSGTKISNVTLGDAIPRVISTAQSNFSIPLDANMILSRFNTGDLSCASQNALITFNGQAQRHGAASAIVRHSATSSQTATPSVKDRRRRQATSTASSEPAVATANGILYDPSLSNMVSSKTGSSLVAAPTAVFAITEEALDFARTAVLFVLQEESLDNAINAQSNLQRFFGLQSYTNAAARNVSIGNTNSVDLLYFAVDLGKGRVGGLNSSTPRKRSDAGQSVTLNIAT